MENKKILRSSCIGLALWLISALLVGICMVTPLIDGGQGIINSQIFVYGPRAAIGDYVNMWNPHYFNHETAFIGVALVFVAITLGIATIVMAIIRKKPALLLSAVGIVVAIGFLPFILILAIPMIQMGVLRISAFLLLAGAFGLELFAIFFVLLPVFRMMLGLLQKAAGEEPKEENCCEGGLDKREVRKLVKEGLDQHVEEYHAEKEEEPAPQPEPEPEPQPQPEPEEEPEEEDEEEEAEDEEEAPAEAGPDGLVIKGKRKRKPFETRLRNSEYDLRHKYYDLRDYIKWYGLRNRVSIPGDTFSYKRQRYVFVTIVGKHLRVYLQLDPKDYADSTIPVEQAEAKKYEDLPCLLRVKSDLAYRRAKKLVDDVMAKVGLPRPEGDEPKETQKKD